MTPSTYLRFLLYFFYFLFSLSRLASILWLVTSFTPIYCSPPSPFLLNYYLPLLYLLGTVHPHRCPLSFYLFLLLLLSTYLPSSPLICPHDPGILRGLRSPLYRLSRDSTTILTTSTLRGSRRGRGDSVRAEKTFSILPALPPIAICR